MTEMEIDKALERLEKAEELVRQKEHKLQQVENRFDHMRNKKDRERTHHLCERAGMLEAIAPDTKLLSSTGRQGTVLCLPTKDALYRTPFCDFSK